MRRLWTVPVLLAAAAAGCGESGSSGGAEAETTTLYVAHFPRDCVGVGPMTCLQVRESPDEEWRLLYQKIEGFDYEPGYDYELRVRTEKVDNPPADGSSIRYILEEVVSRTPMSSEAGAGTGTLEGEWTLASFAPAALEGADDDPTASLETLAARGSAPTLAFSSDGKVAGSSGCNQLTGTYEIEGGHSLSFGPLATTRRACPPPLMSLESLVLAQLESVEGVYVRDGETLELYGPDETLLLTYRRAGDVAAGPQVGTWRLVSFGDAALAGAAAEVVEAAGALGADEKTTPTLALDPSGRAAGFGGCNRYTGSYESDGESAISFGPAAATMRACVGPGMAIESAFLGALPAVAAMSIAGDTLALADGEGEILLRFHRAPDVE
jgi:heat shock protein HslJ